MVCHVGLRGACGRCAALAAPPARWLLLVVAVMMVVNMQTGQASAAKSLDFSDLKGWSKDDQKAAFTAFLQTCPRLLKKSPDSRTKPGFGAIGDWQAVCRAAQQIDPTASNAKIRQFFEQNFRPVELTADSNDRTLFTGYYEPEIEGSREPSPDYTIPLLRPPDDLIRVDGSNKAAHTDDDRHLSYGRMVDGRMVPYFTRAEIEKGALSGRGLELVYLKSRIDAFFLHVQGSGRIGFATAKSCARSLPERMAIPIPRSVASWSNGAS